MTSTYIKTFLILAAFGISIAAAQSPAKDPNATPAPAAKADPAKPQAAQPASPAAEPTLPAVRVGVPAPAFKVATWFKGTPVERLEAGNLYVVEFWATWCGPCRATIPHLTELAHKHNGKVTFVGVSVWERPAEKTNEGISAIVEPFVKDMGDKMDYNVAADTVDRTMATTWMTAAGQNGIPCAFVVGRDGKIAWIGHPMEMDTVLEEVIAGTFDVQAEAKRQEIEWRRQQERQKLEAPIRAAMAAGDNKAVVEAIDKAIAAQPDMETRDDAGAVQLPGANRRARGICISEGSAREGRVRKKALQRLQCGLHREPAGGQAEKPGLCRGGRGDGEG